VAAKNMLGAEIVYAEVPWVWSDQYDCNIQITGHPQPDDDVYLRGDVDGWSFTAVLMRSGRLSGAVSFNRGDDVRAVRRIMTEQRNVPMSLLTDPHADLVALSQDDSFVRIPARGTA
jgi:3-phenylpropionate/trans-cinnamate dioxygenase ferredoxin reductase subunit